MQKTNWMPEIMYEEDDSGLTSNIPFIMVPQNQEMPKVVFIFESRETGEYEPNEDGDPVPIMEMDLHQYADMAILKKGLDSATYDAVRGVLGLQPMREAVPAGQKITDNVRKNLETK